MRSKIGCEGLHVKVTKEYVEIIYLKSNFSNGLQESDCKIIFTGWERAPVRNDEDARPSKKVQGHSGNLCCVLVPVLNWQPGGHHIAVVDRLHLYRRSNYLNFNSQISVLCYLVDIVTVNPCVKKLVQRVQKGHNLSKFLQ